MDINKNEDFSIKIHCFLEELNNTNISKENKENLYHLVNTLTSRTEKQKKRFLLYYGLMPDNSKSLTLSEIGKLENCTISAIQFSVIRVRSTLAILQGEQRNQLLKIINESRGKLL